MGIRIYRSLGWGLNDVQVDSKGDLDDDRFVSQEDFDDISEKNMKDFLDWFSSNRKEAANIIELALPERKNLHHQLGIELDFLINSRWKKTGKFSFTDWSRGYQFDPEFGLPNVMNFIPIEYPSWERRDDAIDYYDVDNFDMKPSVKMLDTFCGLFPYTGAIRNNQKPKVGNLPDYLDPRLWAMLRGTYSESPPISGEEVAQQITESYRPIIADSVMIYTHWLGIWKDWKTTVQELRPMIYTYWG